MMIFHIAAWSEVPYDIHFARVVGAYNGFEKSVGCTLFWDLVWAFSEKKFPKKSLRVGVLTVLRGLAG